MHESQNTEFKSSWHDDYLNVQVKNGCFWNEGALPYGLTLEDLKREHSSRPRNPIIANACFLGGYIDTWGRGTLKIINSCKEAGLPVPEIKEMNGGVAVTLFAGQKPILSEGQGDKFGMISERKWQRHLKLLLNIRNGRQNKLPKNQVRLQEQLKITFPN